MIEEWYVEKIIPNPEWMKKCYNKSFINSEEAINILKEMQKVLGESYYNTSNEYFEVKQKVKEELKSRQEARERELERQGIEQAKINKERAKQILKNKTEEFYNTYPDFKKMGICFDSSRRKVIAMLYDYKYSDFYKSKKELDLAMKPIIKDELLKELYLIISNVKMDK